MLEYHTRRFCFLFKHWVNSFLPVQMTRVCMVPIWQTPTNTKCSRELNLVVNYSSQIIFSKYSRKVFALFILTTHLFSICCIPLVCHEPPLWHYDTKKQETEFCSPKSLLCHKEKYKQTSNRSHSAVRAIVNDRKIDYIRER